MFIGGGEGFGRVLGFKGFAILRGGEVMCMRGLDV